MGADFPNLEAVHDEAIKSARQLLCGDVRKGGFNMHLRFEIKDAAGRSVMTVPLRDAVNLTQALAP